jgi:hypothetical protein
VIQHLQSQACFLPFSVLHAQPEDSVHFLCGHSLECLL